MSYLCGIYKIENSINKKVYIGQSLDIKKRWREHKSAAFNVNSKDYNMVIYKAIRKYGLENFQFSILEECSREDLNARECYWIEYYNSYKKGYNASKGGGNYTHLGNPVELYDYNGNYVTEYTNLMETARALHVFHGTAYQVLYGKRLSVKGYQLKVKGSNKQIGKYKSRQGGKKAIKQMDDNNNVIAQFESAKQAGEILHLDPSTIIKCCKHKLIHCGGFKWEYVEEGER